MNSNWLANSLLCALFAVGVGCSGADLSAGSGVGNHLIPNDSSANGGAAATGGSNVGSGGSNVGTGGSSVTTANGGNRATGGAAGVGTGGAVRVGTGGASTVAGPSWTQLYNNYFASACANACHASMTPTFNSAASMCAVLKTYGHIGNGTASLQNLITWFNQGGTMPLGGGSAPPNAVSDITAWQNAGAVCP